MSGGSYNYLYSKTAGELVEGYGLDLRPIAIRMTQLDILDAAKETEELLTYINHVQIVIDTRMAHLKDILHAVEWYDSGDYGDDSLKQAITEWRNK